MKNLKERIVKAKKSISSTFHIIFATCLIAACTAENSIKVNSEEDKEISIDNRMNDNVFSTHESWRIDSVAENNLVIDRLLEDSVSQVFNFRMDGVFSVMEVTPKITKDRVIGKWKVENDSVFIFGKKGNIVMQYGITFNEDLLSLNGNQISAQNKNRPSFYLSKYIEIKN